MKTGRPEIGQNLLFAVLLGLLASACSGTGSGPEPMGGAPLELRAQAQMPSSNPPVPAPVAAGAGPAISLERAVQAALAFHPSIDEAVGRVRQGQAEIKVARAGYLPTVEGGIDSAYHGGDREGWQPRLNVSGSQMIYDFGKVSSEVNSRAAGTRVSRAELLLGVDQLIRDTATAIIETHRYQSLVEAAQEQLKGVQSIARLVQERSDSGASTQSDEVQANARVVNAESSVLEIGGQLERWRSNLANLTGIHGPIEVSDALPQWLGQACMASEPDWTQTPALLRAQSQMEQAEAQRELSRAQALPTLSLEAGGRYDLANSHLAGRATDPAEFTVGLNLRGRLYEGGAAAARREAADHALASAEAAIRNSRNEISGALLQAQAQLGSLKRMAATLDSRDQLMRRTRDLYRQQYVELGTRTLLDLLNAEQELHQAAFDRVNVQHDLQRLGVDCLFNSGRMRAQFGLEGVTLRGVELRL